VNIRRENGSLCVPVKSVCWAKHDPMTVEMESLKILYEVLNVQLLELATVKRMVAMIMAEKQPSMRNNQECDVLV
jgi:hypothetical protein